MLADEVFKYHVPPIRRLPPLLWTRLRNDLGKNNLGLVIALHVNAQMMGHAEKTNFSRKMLHARNVSIHTSAVNMHTFHLFWSKCKFKMLILVIMHLASLVSRHVTKTEDTVENPNW